MKACRSEDIIKKEPQARHWKKITPTDHTSTLLEILGGSFPTTKHSGGRSGVRGQSQDVLLPGENDLSDMEVPHPLQPLQLCLDLCFLLYKNTIWGKEGLRNGSESLPLTTLAFRCLASEEEATEREGDAGFGGFLLASSFLWRSMSSRCWLMPSCCLYSEFLLFIYLPPQVTVGLLRKNSRDSLKFGCVVMNTVQTLVALQSGKFQAPPPLVLPVLPPVLPLTAPVNLASSNSCLLGSRLCSSSMGPDTRGSTADG
ncbi:hypothetical protein EYF80_035786 [Liparis tanakae]|uniref:Uncharacterized protein n=1 Tax=Liparis tanakae TaxID=230148 RepID=A0A4Z2GKB8_9TELE|nr:hypothetical protein EYF80_035786 [Liparis tanakae]